MFLIGLIYNITASIDYTITQHIYVKPVFIYDCMYQLFINSVQVLRALIM